VGMRIVIVLLLLVTNLPGAELPGAAFPALKRGINLSHWFAQWSDFKPERLHKTITPDDLRLIRSLGLDHVRFSLDQGPLWNSENPSILNPHYLPLVEEAIDAILAADLDVIVDLHPSDDFKLKLRDDDRFVEQAEKFWRSLATVCARRDPRRVAMEVLNEPMVEDAARWKQVAGRLTAAIRQAAPEHLVLVAAPSWSSVKDLLRMELLEADPHIQYTFHFYEPMDFTHQGANWGADWWKGLSQVPYPFTVEAVEKMADQIKDATAARNLKWNAKQAWDRPRIEKTMIEAADWARQKGVKIYLGEFGVYRKFSPPADRARWIEDVRRSAQAASIGWCMWDYAGGFALVNRQDGNTVVDPATAAALGLKP
jgi:aryl-phospho-beta-D-glucosidase BglC (GH1 family)